MTEGTQTYMPVAPVYNGNGGGFGFGDDAWLILILLFACGGFGGFGGFGGYGNMALGYDFPWLLQGQNGINANTNAGFDHAATQSAISSLQNSVTAGFGDVQLGIAGVNQNICQAGNAVTSAVTNGFAQAEIANNSRQIANMQTAFAGQTAMNQGFNSLQSQLAQCCCDNRLATAQTQALVQSENCADRAALSDGIRDIIENNTRNTQAILDKLCTQEIDALKAQNSSLQNQVLMRDLAASQAAQTSQLMADNTLQTQYIVNRVAPYPVPAYPVPNPYTASTPCAYAGY